MSIKLIAEALERSVKTLVEKDEKQLVGLQSDGTYYYDGTNDVPEDIRKKVKKIIIKDDVTEIGYGAFEDCESLESIIIPDSVTEIGYGAFAYCQSLENITLPNTVTEINGEAFYGCKNLKSITIPNSITEIKIGVFHDCISLENIVIPNNVKYIGKWAFAYCSSLENITLPNTVAEIDYAAFRGCSNLKSITIPNSVTEISEDAFYDCESLTSITIPNSVKYIGKWAFAHCISLTVINIPNSVTEIGGEAFSSCENLKSITIPDGVRQIGSRAFASCMNLTDITIPSSVTKISKSTFEACRALKDIYYTGTEEEFNKTNLIYIPRTVRVHYNKTTDKVSGTRQPQKGFLVKEQIRFKLKSTGNVEYIITNTIDSNKDRKEREFEYCELTSDGEFENPQHMTFADFIAKRKTGEVTIISESVNLRDNLRRRNKMKLIKEAIDDTKLRTLVKKACDYMMDEYDYAIDNSAQDFRSKCREYDIEWCEWDGQSDLAQEEEKARIAAVKAAVTSLFAYYPECEHVKALIDAYDIMKGKFSI